MVDFGVFILAVLHSWIAIMSGIASVMMTYCEKVREKNISFRTFQIIAVICFFSAFYFPWDEQYKMRLKAETTNRPPKLLIDTNAPFSTWCLPGDAIRERNINIHTNMLYLGVSFTIGNIGQCTTAARNWSLEIPDITTTLGAAPLGIYATDSKLTVVYPNGETNLYNRDGSLLVKAGYEHPVVPNVPADGYILFEANPVVAAFVVKALRENNKPFDFTLRWDDGQVPGVSYTNKCHWIWP